MNQGRWLKRVIRPLAAEHPPRHLSQVVVDQPKEPFLSRFIAGADRVEQGGELTRGVLAHVRAPLAIDGESTLRARDM
jgi:hypothetical protein